jgi:hypothetical protein
MPSACQNCTKKSRTPHANGQTTQERTLDATHQRRTATPDQMASTSPNGHAPCRNP